MNKIKGFFLLCLACLTFSSVAPVQAWDYNTHEVDDFGGHSREFIDIKDADWDTLIDHSKRQR